MKNNSPEHEGMVIINCTFQQLLPVCMFHFSETSKQYLEHYLHTFCSGPRQTTFSMISKFQN